jgi:deoxyhypusine synthase
MVMKMRKTPYFKEKVRAIEVKDKKISQLLAEMAQTGFQGRKIGEALDTWEEMIEQENLTIFFGYTGSMSTTGMWKIICWLIENRFIDVLISTGANVSEDIIEGMGSSYWKGSDRLDDADLLEHKVDRFHDVLVDELEYRKMEEMIRDFMQSLSWDRGLSSREFLHLFGKWLYKKGVNCIASTAYRKNVPIFCPAIVDSGYGVAAVLAMEKGAKVNIDQAKDFQEFIEIGERSGPRGVIYLGGGVPKDFTQLLSVTLELKKGGKKPLPHEYAIQITTDSPQWGGLSGCTLQEAVSWGKISAGGKHITCYCDSTIALPLIAHALNERVKSRPHAPDLSWIFK